MSSEEIKENSSELKSEYKSRSDRIAKWFKDPYFVTLVAILVAAFTIRIYFMILTKNQAVWWDEGEYMLRVKHLVLGTPQSGFFVGRELFTPYFWATIYYFFKNEIAIRFVQVIISVITVSCTYFLGKEMYDKKIGLFAAAFMTFSWLHLFFTARLLTYLYAPLFYTLAIALFWKGYHSESKTKQKYLTLSFITITVGLGIYFTITLAAVTILLYLLFTEKLNFLKDKTLWKSFFISLPFLLLSFIPSYMVQGSFVPRLSQAATIVSTEVGAGLRSIVLYAEMMPRLMLLIWLIILIASLIVFVRMFLYFDFVIKKKENITEFRKDFYLFVAMLIPYAFYTWVAANAGGPSGATYDAYIMVLFPIMFVFMSRFLIMLSSFLGKFVKDKRLVLALLVIIFIIGAYNQVKFADSSIKGKLDSYYNFKPAGEWIKQNTAPTDKIYSAAVPELTYYSEREIISHGYTPNQTSFIDMINTVRPKYLVLTLWERSPDFIYNLPTSNALNMSVAQAFFINDGSGKQQPDVIIYEIKYSD